MHRALPLLAALLPTAAWASWPEDVTLSGMTEHGGVRVADQAGLQAAYEQLVLEMGTAIANKPLAPAETLGAFGFDFSAGNTFVFVDTRATTGDPPTPWERAHTDESPQNLMFVPSMTARKGLPFSLEAGATASWVGMSRQGAFGGFARLGIVEGYKPWPDLTLQLGYSGYVGNDELELGVLDMGVTLGSTYAFGSFPGIRQAQFAPYLNFSMLQVSAAPILDDDTGEAIFGQEGWTQIGGERTRYDPFPQLAAGWQVTNSTVLFRMLGTWSPATVPTFHMGMGFTF